MVRVNHKQYWKNNEIVYLRIKAISSKAGIKKQIGPIETPGKGF